jgi:hypothetical protein
MIGISALSAFIGVVAVAFESKWLRLAVGIARFLA